MKSNMKGHLTFSSFAVGAPKSTLTGTFISCRTEVSALCPILAWVSAAGPGNCNEK